MEPTPGIKPGIRSYQERVLSLALCRHRSRELLATSVGLTPLSLPPGQFSGGDIADRSFTLRADDRVRTCLIIFTKDAPPPRGPHRHGARYRDRTRNYLITKQAPLPSGTIWHELWCLSAASMFRRPPTRSHRNRRGGTPSMIKRLLWRGALGEAPHGWGERIRTPIRRAKTSCPAVERRPIDWCCST